MFLSWNELIRSHVDVNRYLKHNDITKKISLESATLLILSKRLPHCDNYAFNDDEYKWQQNNFVQ